MFNQTFGQEMLDYGLRSLNPTEHDIRYIKKSNVKLLKLTVLTSCLSVGAMAAGTDYYSGEKTSRIPAYISIASGATQLLVLTASHKNDNPAKIMQGVNVIHGTAAIMFGVINLAKLANAKKVQKPVEIQPFAYKDNGSIFGLSLTYKRKHY